MALLSQNSFAGFSLHPAFKRRIFDWLFLRDAVEGESAIKFKNELYLPMPFSMYLSPSATPSVQLRGYYSQFYEDDVIRTLYESFNPNFHTNQAYSAYLTRASFPEIAGYVLRGLMGLAAKNKPMIKLPNELKYLEKEATVHGMSLEEYYFYLLEEVITNGRIISTIDFKENNKCIFSPYAAESVINWKYKQDTGEDMTLSDIRLIERLPTNYDIKDEKKTSFASNVDIQSVVELSIATGVYTVTKHPVRNGTENIKQRTDVTPMFAGKTLDFIPAMCMGSLNTSFMVNPSPLLPIAKIAVQMYMKSADLAQSEFLSCSPMLVGTGVTPESAPAAVGSNLMMCISNPDAKVYYTRTDTSALNHIKNHIKELFDQAVSLGAQLLDTGNKPAETAETTRLKYAASGATLVSSIRTTANGLEKQLKQIAKLHGANEDEVSFVPSTEFIPPAITAAEIREIVQAWMNDAISHETLFINFKKAGVISEDAEFDDESKKIIDEVVVEGSPKWIRRNSESTANRGGKKAKPGEGGTPDDDNGED